MYPCTAVVQSSGVQPDNVRLPVASTDIPQKSVPITSSSFGL